MTPLLERGSGKFLIDGNVFVRTISGNKIVGIGDPEAYVRIQSNIHKYEGHITIKPDEMGAVVEDNDPVSKSVIEDDLSLVLI